MGGLRDDRDLDITLGLAHVRGYDQEDTTAMNAEQKREFDLLNRLSLKRQAEMKHLESLPTQEAVLRSATAIRGITESLMKNGLMRDPWRRHQLQRIWNLSEFIQRSV